MGDGDGGGRWGAGGGPGEVAAAAWEPALHRETSEQEAGFRFGSAPGNPTALDAQWAPEHYTST